MLGIIGDGKNQGIFHIILANICCKITIFVCSEKQKCKDTLPKQSKYKNNRKLRNTLIEQSPTLIEKSS